MKKIVVFLMLTVLSVGTVLSHGLSMTTARVTLRQQNHLTIRIETSLPDLSSRMNWPNKPKSLMHLSSADEEQITAFRQALKQLFTTQMPVSIGNKPMQSQMVRLPNEKWLRKELQSAVAAKIMAAKMPTHSAHADHDRENYIVINVDGFVAKNADGRNLHIPFPTELGPITVSYSKPQIQTLTAGEKATSYRQRLD